MQRITRLVFALAASALIFAPSTGIAGGDPAAEGEKTYLSKCASCHAKDGSGDTAMGKKLKLRDFKSAVVQKQSDNELHAIAAKGKGKMPGYGKKLTDTQIDEIIAFLRVLPKR